MTQEKNDLFELEAQVSQGLRIAHTKMLAFKKYKGTHVVISCKEKIMFIHPNEM